MSTQKTELSIKTLGCPVLRKKALPVKNVTDEHRQILSQMAQIMYASSGIGLAACQIGLRESFFVADIGTGLYKIVNPKIIRRSGRQSNQEGCLSVPGVYIKVSRAKRVEVEGLDENGKPVVIKAEDLLACVFQHEIDHLRGKMIIDHASLLDKIKIGSKLKTIKERSKNEGMQL